MVKLIKGVNLLVELDLMMTETLMHRNLKKHHLWMAVHMLGMTNLCNKILQPLMKVVKMH